jgi:creatinine amidohydrolase
MTATAETGEEALERFADHLVKAADERHRLRASVTRRAFEDRV